MNKLPAGWVNMRLGELTKIQSGGTPKRSQKSYWGGSIPWYSSGELNERYTKKPNEYITSAGLGNSNAKLFPKGSLLIGMYDTAALKMSILDREAAFNQAIAAVEPKSTFDMYFLKLALSAVKPRVLNERRGIRQKNLSLGKIKNIELTIPPLAEQKRIAAILDKADG
ncbi:MAG: restriction endonuclease subunit S, partial [Planctomycetota bacterium]|nr:restriction endonuclease subunit S [Planctomycetota bacterium]